LPIPRPTVSRTLPVPPGRSRSVVGRRPLDTMLRVTRALRHRSGPPAWVPRSRSWIGRVPREQLDVLACLRADYRVEDTTIAGYRIWYGQDSEPDLSAAPDETASSLPHTTAALAAGHTYHVVTRHMNAYGLESQNITSWTVTTDGGGAAEATNPSAPQGISVEPAANGAVRILADYFPVPDGDDAATIWAIWITDDGSTPDTGTAATATETMTAGMGFAHLEYTSGSYSDGATIKVIVRARRVDAGPTNVDSTNSTVYSTTADTDGPSAPTGSVFHDEDAEEAQ